MLTSSFEDETDIYRMNTRSDPSQLNTPIKVLYQKRKYPYKNKQKYRVFAIFQTNVANFQLRITLLYCNDIIWCSFRIILPFLRLIFYNSPNLKIWLLDLNYIQCDNFNVVIGHIVLKQTIVSYHFSLSNKRIFLDDCCVA